MPVETGFRPRAFGSPIHATLDSQAGFVQPVPTPETRRTMSAVTLLRQDFNTLARRTVLKETHPRADRLLAPGEREALAKISPTLGKRYENVAGILRAIEAVYHAEYAEGVGIQAILKKELSPLVDEYGLTITEGSHRTVEGYHEKIDGHIKRVASQDTTEPIDKNDLLYRYAYDALRRPGLSAGSISDAEESNEVGFGSGGVSQDTPPRATSSLFKDYHQMSYAQSGDYFVPTGNWSFYPSFQEHAAHVNRIRSVASNIYAVDYYDKSRQIWENGASGKVTSHRIAGEMLYVAELHLLKGIDGTSLYTYLDGLVMSLNELLQYFGLRVDVKEEKKNTGNAAAIDGQENKQGGSENSGTQAKRRG